MKIDVRYYTQTGNSKKLAEEALQRCTQDIQMRQISLLQTNLPKAFANKRSIYHE